MLVAVEFAKQAGSNIIDAESYVRSANWISITCTALTVMHTPTGCRL